MFEHLDDVNDVAGGDFEEVEGGDERFELGLAGIATDVEGDGLVNGWLIGADLDQAILVHYGDGADFDVGADDKDAFALVDDNARVNLWW